jgi:uncharacterized cupin superfamily protein
VSVEKVNLRSVELDEPLDEAGFRHAATAVGPRLGARRIGAGVYEAEAGVPIWPYHYHHGVEEWLVVLAGEPTLRTPDGERRLEPGDTVCFPSGAGGAHSVLGPGRLLVLSANRDQSVVVYPDSDKLGTRPSGQSDRLNFRRADAVGYWEGEV